MIEILIILLIILWILVYILNNRKIFSPSLIMISLFIFSSFIAFLNKNEWRNPFHYNTILVICIGLLCFIFGEFFISKTNVSIKNKKKYIFFKSVNDQYISIKKFYIILICIFMMITFISYFRYIYSISLVAGNKYGYSQMFKYARYAVINVKYGVSEPILLAHCLIISKCLGYIFLFVIVYNKILYDKFELLYFWPCILYLLQILISTARLDFITFLCAYLVYYFTISTKKRDWNNHLNVYLIGKCMVVLIILFSGFRFLGTFTGKTETRELWSDISIYSGSSIYALDNYLNSEHSENDFFGKETLRNVYKMLYRVGLTDIEPYNIPLEFTYFPNGTRTNIYTQYRRLIQDYGFIGMGIIQFFEGIFYGYLTKKQQINKYLGLNTIVFAYLFFPITQSFFEEKFIINFTTIDLVYHLFYFFVLYKLIIKSRFFLKP